MGVHPGPGQVLPSLPERCRAFADHVSPPRIAFASRDLVSVVRVPVLGQDIQKVASAQDPRIDMMVRVFHDAPEQGLQDGRFFLRRRHVQVEGQDVGRLVRVCVHFGNADGGVLVLFEERPIESLPDVTGKGPQGFLVILAAEKAGHRRHEIHVMVIIPGRRQLDRRLLRDDAPWRAPVAVFPEFADDVVLGVPAQELDVTLEGEVMSFDDAGVAVIQVHQPDEDRVSGTPGRVGRIEPGHVGRDDVRQAAVLLLGEPDVLQIFRVEGRHVEVEDGLLGR